MSLSRIVRFAAYSWLPVFALAGITQAQTVSYNVASDWAYTYPTSGSLPDGLKTATSATWGPDGRGGWSAGEMSFNWTNYGAQTENLTTYFSATPTVASTSAATYTYTVPFQTYQLNPASSIQQQIGPVAGNTIMSHLNTAQGSTIGLHAGSAVGTTTTGYLNQTGAIEGISFVSGKMLATDAYGFTTTGFSNISQVQDGASGNNTVPSEVPGVFYNYTTTNTTSTNFAVANTPSGSGDNVVELAASAGPTYVAWTAPANGTITSVSLNAWDMRESASDNDGYSNFFVMTSVGGPSAPILTAEHGSGVPIGVAGSTLSSTVGSASNLATYPTGYSSSNANGITWSASGIAVTAGEILYFVADPGHSGGNHTFYGAMDPIVLQTNISFVPEPSSIVLLGLGSLGLAFSAWKRRRPAA